MPHEEEKPRRRSSIDEIIDIYRRDVDMTLLRENLKLTPDERSRKFEDFMASLEEIRGAAKANARNQLDDSDCEQKSRHASHDRT